MTPTVTIRRDPQHDALTAEVLIKGTFGVAQLRAVVPLKKIRQFLDARVQAEGGPPSSVSGSRHPAAERAVTQVAGRALLSTITAAARAPMQQAASSAQRVRTLAMKLAGLAQAGQIDDWKQVMSVLARRRKAAFRARVMGGTPPHVALALMKREEMETQAAIRMAAEAVELESDVVDEDENEPDEHEDGDFEDSDDEDGDTLYGTGTSDVGWNPFKTIAKGAKGLARGVSRPFRKKRPATLEQRQEAARRRREAAEAETETKAMEQEAADAEAQSKEPAESADDAALAREEAELQQQQ